LQQNEKQSVVIRASEHPKFVRFHFGKRFSVHMASMLL